MARKRTKRKKFKHNKTPPAMQSGFDYGCLPNALAVGSPEFPRLLTEAQVDAVACGTRHSPELNAEVPTIALVAQHGDPLAKAFSIFHDWSTSSDSDAVELTFVLRDPGGYVLVISPEPARMEQRCLGYDRTHQIISAAHMWCKPIDSLSPTLLTFRDHCASTRIAPYLLEGATYTGSANAIRMGTSVDLRGVSGLQPLLKFEVTFVDASEATPGTIGWVASNIQSSPNVQSPQRRDKAAPNEISSRRTRALSHHFPVTLERMRVTPEIRRIVDDLQRDGIEPWQLEQAICNLILESDLQKAGATRRPQMMERTTRALAARYEVADGSGLPLFGIDLIRRQVLADGNELLTHMNAKRTNDLSSLQARLRSLSLLECLSVVVQKGA